MLKKGFWFWWWGVAKMGMVHVKNLEIRARATLRPKFVPGRSCTATNEWILNFHVCLHSDSS
jgi:hypothetical protein